MQNFGLQQQIIEQKIITTITKGYQVFWEKKAIKWSIYFYMYAVMFYNQ